MTTDKINLSLVSYLNTLPFIQGFKQFPDHKFNLIFKTPAEGARSFFDGECDLALLPVGALLYRDNYEIYTDYCIGCNGAVRTVGVFSDKPIDQLKTIYLDLDSRTSVLLIRVLLKNKGLHSIEFKEGLDNYFLEKNEDSGFLAIGDKVFEYEKQFTYFFDLGLAWKETFNLPFAFAVFVGKPGLDALQIAELNKILRSGIDHIQDMELDAYATIPDFRSYFTHNISYQLDNQKKIAMDMFIKEALSLKVG